MKFDIIKKPQNVIREIVALRTENSKTFELSGGRRCLCSVAHPVHIKNSNGEYVDIDIKIVGGKVVGAPYTASIFSDTIGYSVVSKKDGSRVDVKMQDVFYKKPIIVDNKVIYENVSTDLDIIIEFRPKWVRLWKKLKSSKAKKSFKFRVFSDKKGGEVSPRRQIIGFDSTVTPVVLNKTQREIRRFVAFSGKDVIEEEWIDTFSGKKVFRDKKTRVKKLSADVSYPVMIDTDVNVGISSSGGDGTDSWFTDGTYPFSSLYKSNNTVSLYYASWAQKEPYFRFTGITIPQSSTISSATITIYYKMEGSYNYSFYANAFDENNPAEPSSAGDIRNKTTGLTSNKATVQVSPASSWTPKQITVTDTVQELVNSYDYSNEAMLFFFRHKSIYISYTVNIYAYDQGTSQDAQLSITYSPGSSSENDAIFFGMDF